MSAESSASTFSTSNVQEKRMFPLHRTPYCPMTLRFWHWVSIKLYKSAFGFERASRTDRKEKHGEKSKTQPVMETGISRCRDSRLRRLGTGFPPRKGLLDYRRGDCRRKHLPLRSCTGFWLSVAGDVTADGSGAAPAGTFCPARYRDPSLDHRPRLPDRGHQDTP